MFHTMYKMFDKCLIKRLLAYRLDIGICELIILDVYSISSKK